MNDFLKTIKLFIFDLDGTLYAGENAIPKAVELIKYLRQRYKVIFFTNNSSKTRIEINDKLNRLGFESKLEEVYATSAFTALYLRDARLDNLYVLGSNGFIEEIELQGLRVINNESADNVVVGLDLNISYEKITKALTILLKKGKFIVCNEDSNFSAGTGKFLPGCGAIVGAISGAIGRKPDFIVGKPNTYILSKISNDLSVKANEIIIVGDSYQSDIQMALNYKCKAIFLNLNKNLTYNNDNIIEINTLEKLF